jgi:serine/threonine protein kinase
MIQTMPAPRDLQADVDRGPYRWLRALARGGMAEVHLVEHRGLGEVRVMKVLRDALGDDEEMVARLRAEGRMAATLRHENLVVMYDFGFTPAGRAFLVMEYLEGEPLKQLLRRDGALGIERTTRFASQMLAGLGAVHARRFVHRDVKPDNLFVTAKDGQRFIKILDFGVSKVLGAATRVQVGLGSQHTKEGWVIGTPMYMAPEQVLAQKVDPRADIYAAGCVLFHMLTGGAPFVRASQLEIFEAHVQEMPELPSRLANVPPSFDAIVLKAMAKSPAERFQSAEEMSRAIVAAAEAARDLRQRGPALPARTMKLVAGIAPLPAGAPPAASAPPQEEAPPPPADHDTLIEQRPAALVDADRVHRAEELPRSRASDDPPTPERAVYAGKADVEQPRPADPPARRVPRTVKAQPSLFTFEERSRAQPPAHERVDLYAAAGLDRSSRLAWVRWALAIVVALAAAVLLLRFLVWPALTRHSGLSGSAWSVYLAGGHTMSTSEIPRGPRGTFRMPSLPEVDGEPTPIDPPPFDFIELQREAAELLRQLEQDARGASVDAKAQAASAAVSSPDGSSSPPSSPPDASMRDGAASGASPEPSASPASGSDAGAPESRRLATLRRGDCIASHRVLALLAEGGMALVFKCARESTGEHRALKILREQYRRHPIVIERFVAEAQVMQDATGHPNLVRVFESGEDPRVGHYIIMELLRGVNLREWIRSYNKRGKRVPHEEALRVVIEVADALHDSHEAGVIHRDVKPENVFLVLDDAGKIAGVKIIDFGAAKSKHGPHTTQDGVTVATALYMAPEQIERKRVTGAADQFSLTHVLLELLDRHAFDEAIRQSSANELVYLRWQANMAIERPDEAYVTDEEWIVIERGFRRDPADRFPTMRAYADALREALAAWLGRSDVHRRARADEEPGERDDAVAARLDPAKRPTAKSLAGPLVVRGMETTALPRGERELPARGKRSPKGRYELADDVDRPTLVVFMPPELAGRRFDLGEDGVIGRNPAEADLVIDHPSVSRRHVRYSFVTGTRRDPIYGVQDLGGTNGTQVAHEPLRAGARSIRIGEFLRIGDVVCAVAPPGPLVRTQPVAREAHEPVPLRERSRGPRPRDVALLTGGIVALASLGLWAALRLGWIGPSSAPAHVDPSTATPATPTTALAAVPAVTHAAGAATPSGAPNDAPPSSSTPATAAAGATSATTAPPGAAPLPGAMLPGTMPKAALPPASPAPTPSAAASARGNPWAPVWVSPPNHDGKFTPSGL